MAKISPVNGFRITPFALLAPECFKPRLNASRRIVWMFTSIVRCMSAPFCASGF